MASSAEIAPAARTAAAPGTGNKAAPAPVVAAQPFPVWLWGACAALLGLAVLMAATHVFIQHKIERNPQRFNVYPLPEKLLGLALQRHAFTDPTLLPVYGSSELTQSETNRADRFFSAHPTGFGAFLIGNPGETCLMITSKLAAADPADVRGKKAVVFLSPGWFLAPELDHPGFGVNFSPLHGGVFTFENTLSPSLRADLARRLLAYPDIIAKYPLLKAGLTCLADDTPGQRALRAAIAPMGAVHNRVQRELDYARLGLWWYREGNRVAPERTPLDKPARIDWDARLRAAAATYDKQPTITSYCVGPRTGFDDRQRGMFTDPTHPERTADENFARLCGASREWTDYRLLLRTARELGISVLVVCQPLNANFNTIQGVTAAARAGFYDRLRAETAPFGVPLLTYPKEGEDPHYFHDASHPTAMMWLVYDRALDAFYHQPAKPAP